VGPGLVDGPAAAALDLLGEVLPGLGHGLVGQRDQVKVINRDRRAGKPHPQRLSERRRRVDRHDLHRQPPLQGPGEQPVPDTLVVAAVNHAQDLTGVQVNDGCHPRLEACPRLRCGVLEVAHRPETVLINAQHPRAELVHVRQLEQTCFGHRGPDHPPGHSEARGGLRHGPAGADDSIHELVRSRLVERARRGTCGVDSKNDSRSHAGSSQYQRYLDQSTSTGPATGISRSRCTRRSFRRDAMTPQLGQPGGWSVSTMTCRRPAVTVVEMTR
jgi:hypothetical protein